MTSTSTTVFEPRLDVGVSLRRDRAFRRNADGTSPPRRSTTGGGAGDISGRCTLPSGSTSVTRPTINPSLFVDFVGVQVAAALCRPLGGRRGRAVPKSSLVKSWIRRVRSPVPAKCLPQALLVRFLGPERAVEFSETFYGYSFPSARRVVPIARCRFVLRSRYTLPMAELQYLWSLSRTRVRRVLRQVGRAQPSRRRPPRRGSARQEARVSVLRLA